MRQINLSEKNLFKEKTAQVAGVRQKLLGSGMEGVETGRVWAIPALFASSLHGAGYRLLPKCPYTAETLRALYPS